MWGSLLCLITRRRVLSTVAVVCVRTVTSLQSARCADGSSLLRLKLLPLVWYIITLSFFFFTLDSVQRHTHWGSLPRINKNLLPTLSLAPRSSRINMCGGVFFFFFFFPSSLVSSGGIEVLSFSFIHRGVKEEWKWNASAWLMSSARRYRRVFRKRRISFFFLFLFNQMILYALYGVLHAGYSVRMTVSPFYLHPVCSNIHFQIIVTIKKNK